MTKKFFLLFILLLLTNLITHSQDQQSSEEQHAEKVRHHWINVFSGITFIEEASTDGMNSQLLIVPTFAVDYEYIINHKFALVWSNDVELASYVVEDDASEELKREFAVVSSVVLAYSLYPFWAVFAGPGYEFETHQNFFVMKIGTELKKEFEDGWGLGISLSVDLKDVNTSGTLGLVIKKAISKAK